MKLIFLDIDGTIYSGANEILDSVKQAIQSARKNGHKVCLNTGRSRVQIPKSLWKIGFDGMIGSAGAYIEVEDKVMFHQPLETRYVRPVCEFLLEKNIMFLVEANHCMYGTQTCIEYQKNRFEGASEEILDCFVHSLVHREDITEVKDANKIMFFMSPIEFEVIYHKFAKELSVIQGTQTFNKGICGEIYSKERNKALAMEQVAQYYQVAMSDTIAFGDGHNDHEMIEAAGIGVAMGNGVPELKEKADFITKPAKEDGIYYGFQQLGLF